MLRRKFQSHPVGVKILGFLVGVVFRLWMWTLDYRFVMRAGASNPPWAEKPMLYVFWHEMLLFPVYTHSRFNVAALVSRHRDGELLAEVLRMLRGKVIRGSTSRDGVSGLRSMIRRGGIGHLAIAPDGPLGPRRVFQAGAIFLASRAQIPIVPVGFAVDKYWCANSWDRMVLPRPFARAFCIFKDPAGPFVPRW